MSFFYPLQKDGTCDANSIPCWIRNDNDKPKKKIGEVISATKPPTIPRNYSGPDHSETRRGRKLACCTGLSMDLLIELMKDLNFEVELYEVADRLWGGWTVCFYSRLLNTKHLILFLNCRWIISLLEEPLDRTNLDRCWIVFPVSRLKNGQKAILCEVIDVDLKKSIISGHCVSSRFLCYRNSGGRERRPIQAVVHSRHLSDLQPVKKPERFRMLHSPWKLCS